MANRGKRMSKNKLISALALMMFAFIPYGFAANITTNNHNAAHFVNSVRVVEHRPANPNSEFTTNSSFKSSEEFSQSQLFLHKKKSELLKKTSIAKESSFSTKTFYHPKAKNEEFLESSFSIHDDAEFSGKPSTAPKYNSGEFSNAPTVFSRSVFNTRWN
jgi:hypothetical protein